MCNLPKRKFSLLTTIAMIVGIVIGSGIFFRVPTIIRTVNGNLGAGILVFLVASFGIIFGGLTIARFASASSKDGGIVDYCEASWGKTFGYMAGWFQTIIYFPAISAILAWVAANYTAAIFGWPNLLIDQSFGWQIWALTLTYLLGIMILNVFSTISAGRFQSLAMIIKIGTLLVLGTTGLIFGQPGTIVSTTLSKTVSSSNFFLAIVIVAYAFDGWLIAPFIAHEIKDTKKNLPLALTLAPLLITGIYLLYFIGASIVTGVDNIIAGTDPIKALGQTLFTEVVFKIILIFITISVLGTLNGVFLGYMRLPYSLARRHEIPFSQSLQKIHPQYDVPVASSLLAFGLTIFWIFLHFLSIDGAILYQLTWVEGLEVDNLPIVLNHLFYISLYLGALIKFKAADKSIFYNYVIPIFAIIGASFILYGGFSEEKFNLYLIISLIAILAGLLIRPKSVV